MNLRDLGGLPTASGATTLHGRLLRSESPHTLSAVGLQELLDLGIGAVIDLRTTWSVSTDRARSSMRASHRTRAHLHRRRGLPRSPRHRRRSLLLVAARAPIPSRCGDDRHHRRAVGAVVRALSRRAKIAQAWWSLSCSASPASASTRSPTITRSAVCSSPTCSRDKVVDRAGAWYGCGSRRRGFSRFVVRRWCEPMACIDTEHGGVVAFFRGLGLDEARIACLTNLLLSPSWP